MKASELVRLLAMQIEEHGDLDVALEDAEFRCRDAVTGVSTAEYNHGGNKHWMDDDRLGAKFFVLSTD